MTYATNIFRGRGRFVLVGVLLCVLTACAAGPRGDAPPTALVVAYDPVTGEEVITTAREAYKPGLFSVEVRRETSFSGNSRARLTNHEDNEPSGFIDASSINRGAFPGSGPDDGFEGEIGRTEAVIEPLDSQPMEGAVWQPRYSDRPTVRLNYENEELTQVVQNILGGILGQNFIIGEGVIGTVTFRSNTRFARAQLVQILADILARQGYVMRYFNGIYYVATPQEIDQLTAARARTGLAGDEVRSIEVPGDAAALASTLSLLVPPSIQIAGGGDGQLLVRGDPSQFASLEQLVRTLVDTGVASQKVAIIPLRENDPVRVANELSRLYESRGIGGVTAIPLENRQGILVAANSDATLREVRGVVQALDVDRRDRSSLRVIQLTHSRAEDVATQIAQLFGAGVDVAAAAQTADNGSAVLQSAAALGSQSAAEASGVRAPTTIRANGGTGQAGTNGSATGAAPADTSSAGISVVADNRNNAVLVRSTYAEFVRIQQVVRALDTPVAQVVIEATIVEVEINDELQLGVQAFLEGNGFSVRSSSGSGGVGDPGGSGFAATFSKSFGGSDVSAVVAALQGVSDVRVISSPYVTVTDGSPASLSVGQQIPFTTTSQSSSNDGTVVVTQEIETRDVGVILNVTPRIRPDNSVLLDIAQTVSSVGQVTGAAGTNPTISQRSVASQVTIDSGRTVLLGGLIAERSDKSEGGVPVVRDIPVVGGLFRQRFDNQNRSEVLVMITPRVVRNGDALTNLTEQIRWAATSQ